MAAKNPKYTTPKCRASYPYFNKPDEYKGSERYKADLIVDREEAAPFMEKCEEVLKKFVETHNKAIESGEKKGKKLNLKKALANGLPWDDHEENEDLIVIKVKQNAEVSGDRVKLIFYDAKGQRIKNPPIVRGGSIVKVAGTIRGYEGFGGGVTLSISAVQIIELSEGSDSDVDADNFGFGEEEGFEYEGTPDGFEEDDGEGYQHDADEDEDEEEEF